MIYNEGISHRILLGLSVLTSVQLDDQGSFAAGEISEVWANWKLANELVPAEPTTTDDLPEAMLGLRLVAAKRASARD